MVSISEELRMAEYRFEGRRCRIYVEKLVIRGKVNGKSV